MKNITNTTDLFEPVTLGSLRLANRLAMAPLTRSRIGEDGIPTELHATYYAQRASAGLLISESTNFLPQARGYLAGRAGAGRQKVTAAVHAAGGQIVCQLWHIEAACGARP